MFRDALSGPGPTNTDLTGAVDRGLQPDFVVVDVETACSSVSSICQIGIVGFRNGVKVFEYETLVKPIVPVACFCGPLDSPSVKIDRNKAISGLSPATLKRLSAIGA